MVAVVQRPPVLLDREATLKGAVEHLHEAADAGARLIVFPETYLPGYPAWIWKLRPGSDYDLSDAIYRELLDNSVDLVADDLRPLREAAAQRNVVVVCGVHERDGAHSRATLYNTLVTIGADGSILNLHRKLVPTNPERMVWGYGDARGLRVVDTPIGGSGADLLGELHAARALRALLGGRRGLRRVDVGRRRHVDRDDAPHRGRRTLLGHRRRAARCTPPTFPPDFPNAIMSSRSPDAWLNGGDSVVVAPGGTIVAGPLHEEHGLLLAEIDPHASAGGHRTLDVAGHYSRNDIFHLTIDRAPQEPVRVPNRHKVPP